MQPNVVILYILILDCATIIIYHQVISIAVSQIQIIIIWATVDGILP